MNSIINRFTLMNQENEPLTRIRIEIYDDATGRLLGTEITTQAVFAIGYHTDDMAMAIKLNMVGKRDDVVTILNYQVQAMTMQLGLKAMFQQGVPSPYFVIENKES